MTEPKDKVILVVDDMGTIRAAMAHHLKTAGYKTIEAESGASALQIAFREPPDLIILDVMMPKIDGFTVLERLRKEESTAKLPVIICTAKGFREDVLRASQLGASDYIVKPFSKAIVLEKVKRLIGDPPPVRKAPKPPVAVKAAAKPKPDEESPPAAPPAPAPPEKPPE